MAAKVLQESVGDLVAVNIRSENSAQFLAFHRSEIVESVKSLPKNEWVGIKVIDRSEKKVRIHGQKIQAVFK
ncbi:hypothetical protein, partial [Shewanella algae]|uniref:hypothetical protein n=1 Tax=Shewanella algae TaxID=38313 RepID=UPI00313C2C73